MQTTKAGRGYSKAYKDHRGLISKMAAKSTFILNKMGVCIDFEDVFQEMSMIYCKVIDKYDPERGITFTAYLGRSISNDFQKFADRLIKSETNLGLVRFEDMSWFKDEDEDGDILEAIPSQCPSPEEEYMASRTFMDAVVGLNDTERCVVGKLMRRDLMTNDRRELSLSKIMYSMNLSRRTMERSRKKIFEAFEIER